MTKFSFIPGSHVRILFSSRKTKRRVKYGLIIKEKRTKSKKGCKNPGNSFSACMQKAKREREKSINWLEYYKNRVQREFLMYASSY